MLYGDACYDVGIRLRLSWSGRLHADATKFLSACMHACASLCCACQCVPIASPRWAIRTWSQQIAREVAVPLVVVG